MGVPRSSPPPPLVVAQPHVWLGDPHVCTDDRSRLSILHCVFEPLVRRGLRGTYVPALADRWSVTPDARTWTFELREGAAAHDGRRLTAQDAVASLERIRDHPPAGELGTTGVYQAYLAGCEIHAVQDRVLEVRTPKGSADLLDVLVELFVLPERVLDDADRALVGTGQYRVVERDDELVVMERVSKGGPYASSFERVQWLAMLDANERVEGVRSGDVDIATDLAPRVDDIRAWWQAGSVVTAFMFAMTEGPTSDKRVRQALNLAVDVKALVEGLFAGRADAVAAPCGPTQLGFDPDLEPYRHDPVAARALLTAAGCDGLHLTFDIPSRLPDEAPLLAEWIRRDLADVGVGLDVIEHRDRPAYAETVRAKRIHDAACFDSSPHSTFRLFREKFHAGVRGPWWFGFDDPVFDRMVDEASATVDLDRRRGLYRSAAHRVHEAAPWLDLYAGHIGWGLSKRLAAWRPTLDGLVRPSVGIGDGTDA